MTLKPNSLQVLKYILVLILLIFCRYIVEIVIKVKIIL